ncbi:MAG: MFS transporter [candidate division WOR-3 bacterium]
MSQEIIEEKERKESLKNSFLDGLFASLNLGFSQNYLVPFALFLGASSFQIGLLSSLPQFAGSLAQIASPDIVERLKRRVKFIANAVFLQAFLWLLIALLPIFPMEKITLYIILLTINTSFGAAATPAWQSLMSDTVEKERYGEYFAWRGRVLGFISLLANFTAGFLLFLFSANKILGFFLIFFISGLTRGISGYFINRMYDIPLRVLPERRFSYFAFIKRLPESNFVKFTLFVSGMYFAAFIAAPFFSVYMLRDLKFAYSTYTLITTSSTLASLLALPFWGKYADRYGNARILKASSFLISLIPLLWLLSPNPIYLILLNAFAGYAWSGFNLCTVNFIFDAASPEVRTRCLGYFNFTNGVTIFLGGLIGGFLATRLPPFFSRSPLLTLFLLSGILRIMVDVILLPKFKEVRPTEPIERKELLSVILGIKPLLSLSEDILFWKKK